MRSSLLTLSLLPFSFLVSADTETPTTTSTLISLLGAQDGHPTLGPGPEVTNGISATSSIAVSETGDVSMSQTSVMTMASGTEMSAATGTATAATTSSSRSAALAAGGYGDIGISGVVAWIVVALAL